MNQFSTSTSDAFVAPAILLVLLVVFVVLYLIGGYLLGRILAKAGEPLWVGFVPVYNQWKLYELGGFGGWWSILALIPGVNFVAVIVLFIAQYRIGLGFGKSGAFVLWAILVPIVWYIWLAFDASRWNPERALPSPMRY